MTLKQVTASVAQKAIFFLYSPQKVIACTLKMEKNICLRDFFTASQTQPRDLCVRAKNAI